MPRNIIEVPVKQRYLSHVHDSAVHKSQDTEGTNLGIRQQLKA